MEKLCIVKRRSKPTQPQGPDSTTTIVTQEPETVVEERDLQAIEIENAPSTNASSSINVHDGDHLIFKEVAGEEEQIFSIQLTPQQSQVVQSMNCI